MATFSTFLGFFNICAGLMLVASLLLFLGGFVRYLVVLGTQRREGGLALMFWGITVLFVLVVLLAIINVLQGPIAFIIGIVVVLFLCFVIMLALSRAKFGAGEHKEP